MNCLICNKVLKGPPSQHYKTHHPDEERECKVCRKTKNVLDSKMFNDEICIKCKDKRKCGKCNKYFGQKYLKEHICDGEKDFTKRRCNKCGEEKAIGTEIYASKYTCKACLSEKEECDICKKMILKSNINHHKLKHTETNQTESVSQYCNNCKLAKDLKEFYIGRYTCTECLRKKVDCQHCGKVYTFRSIKEHVKKAHNSK